MSECIYLRVEVLVRTWEELTPPMDMLLEVLDTLMIGREEEAEEDITTLPSMDPSNLFLP